MTRTAKTGLTIMGTRDIKLNGRNITYTVKRSARAKLARIEISQKTGLSVIIPKSYSTNKIDGLLKQKQSWITSKLTKYEQVISIPHSSDLKNGDTLPYLGRDLKVEINTNGSKTEIIKISKGKLIVGIGNNGSKLNEILERWYRMQAVELLSKKTNDFSAKMGLAYRQITIRGQKTRWGSCSRKGNLSFNWKLMMAPEPIVDYVVIHELAHLQEMNHSKDFWDLVTVYCPRWRDHKKWLKTHGADLLAKLSS